ncbi:MAG: DUF2339 domain-containing protein [Bacteroidetes bacterium]|nr:DUF2339 domain-containing protein [Bacteroidota bacterium]
MQNWNELLNRLEEISKKYQDANLEISKLRYEILMQMEKESAKDEVHEEEVISNPKTEDLPPFQPVNPAPEKLKVKQSNESFERFIGENIASKLGIVVLIIGVAFGVKYAIDHQWIGAGLRIFLGYLLGFGLYFVSRYLKEKYSSFASVLSGGSIVINYLITFGAFNNFHLFPQWLSFLIMVLFTALCVYEAIRYDKILIAHLGLIGAYCIPFLLTTGDENIRALLTYFALINAGILCISYFKNWLSLHWVSLIVTWSVTGIWYAFEADSLQDDRLAILFSFVFYLLFYASYILYQIRYRIKVSLSHILLVLINSFTAYLIGYVALLGFQPEHNYSGMFTITHALIHLVFASLIYYKNREDRTLLMMLFVLFVASIIIAVPVQLNGNWVTLLWLAEAIALFYAAFRTNYRFLFQVSVMLFGFAALSHILDLRSEFDKSSFEAHTLIWNISTLTTFIYFIASLLPAFWVARQHSENKYVQFLSGAIVLGGVFILFLGSDQQLAIYLSHGEAYHLPNWLRYWQWIYGGFYIGVFSAISMHPKWKKFAGSFAIVIGTFMVFALTTEVAKIFAMEDSPHYHFQEWHYYVFEGMLLALAFLGTTIVKKRLPVAAWKYTEIFLMLLVFWMGSIEWMHRAKHAGIHNEFRFGLSMLWGILAMAFVLIGIFKGKAHFRIFALGLFGIVFLKLFMYDSREMETLPKTILYISLGLLLLVVSFLYNRFKSLWISEDKENSE